MDPKDIPLPLATAVALVFAIALYIYTRPKPHYPPGPKGLPLIGSLLDINQERPWITYGKWAREYGDIVMYWVMGNPVILLGKMEHAENLLQKRMTNYGDRPELVVAQDFVTQNGWYIGTSRTKHDTHKKHRKILGERLRANALQDWAHPAETPEVHLLLHRIARQPERFVTAIKCFTINVMLGTTFAHSSIADLDNPIIARINAATDNQFTAQIQGRFIVDYLPILKKLPAWLPGMGWKRKALTWRKEVNALYQELWDMVKARKDEDEVHPSLVRTLMRNHMHQITENEGTTISSAIVDAGTDTLSATSVVFFIIFMYFPDVLRKAQQVVDEAIGRDRLPTFEDIHRIPYITAMVRETFRWHTVAPVAIPHAVLEDDVYAGYLIPKGATIFALSQHIHEDEELYPDPLMFKPERFLDENGKLNTLPHSGFGFGSRKCLGMHFAEQTLFLVLASFLWSFDVEAPVDAQGNKVLPSLDPMDWGAFLASPPPMDFQCIIKPRSKAVMDIIDQTVDADNELK